MRQRFGICGLLIFLMLMSGCEQNSCELIDHNNQDLTESMQNYYHDDVNSHVIGENFEAKIIAFDKVLVMDENHGEINKYKVIITVAPLCNKDISVKDFEFSLSNEAHDYFNKYPHMIGDDLLPMVKFGTNMNYRVNDISEMQAYRFELLFDNAGSKNQLDNNYTDEAFDDLVNDITMTVYYNRTEEVLHLKYVDDIKYYQKLEDIPSQRQDLKDIFENKLNKHQVAGFYSSSGWE